MPAARRVLLIGLAAHAAGCGGTASSPSKAVLANRTPQPPSSRWQISARGIGPVTASSVATLDELREAFPGLRVEAHDLSGRAGIVFDVFDGDERLLYVVPDDGPGYVDGDPTHLYATTVFAAFAVSPRIPVAGRTWRVGQPLEDAHGLDHCECWGEGEVTACFPIGSHVRVIFEFPCEMATNEGVRSVIGKPIDRIMWKRVLEPPGLLDDEPAP